MSRELLKSLFRMIKQSGDFAIRPFTCLIIVSSTFSTFALESVSMIMAYTLFPR